jgi:hypothetical protein
MHVEQIDMVDRKSVQVAGTMHVVNCGQPCLNCAKAAICRVRAQTVRFLGIRGPMHPNAADRPTAAGEP